MKTIIRLLSLVSIIGVAVAHGTEPSEWEVVQAPAIAGKGAKISSRDRVYTADQTSNTVSVIDPYKMALLGTIALGDPRLTDVIGPQYIKNIDVHGIGFSRDGKYICVLSIATNTVTVIRTIDNSIISQTWVGRATHEAFFSPDGRTVWVGARGTAAVNIVDPFTGSMYGKLAGTIPTAPGPSKVLFSPKGDLAYVNHLASASVDIIDVKKRKVIDTITGLPSAFSSDEGLSADGTSLWVSHKLAGLISVLDMTTRKLVAVLPAGASVNHPEFVDLGDKKLVFVTIGNLNHTKVYRQDKASDVPILIDVIKSTGITPHGIWPSADNTRIFYVNERSDTVDVVDTTTLKIIETINVGQEGNALVYVSNAVPTGNGTANLGTQGLHYPVYNSIGLAPMDPKATVSVTSRSLTGVEMFQVVAGGLRPNVSYTAWATHNATGTQVPIMDFTASVYSNVTGLLGGSVPQALSFLRFRNVYDVNSVVVKPSGM